MGGRNGKDPTLVAAATASTGGGGGITEKTPDFISGGSRISV